MLKNQQSGFNQALWLGISQASSFVLAFLSAAILSRYFDKTEYGTYKQIIYVYTTLQTVFTAGLPGVFSYFLPQYSDAEGKTLVNRITRVFFILGLVFSVVLYSTSGLIADLLKNPELEIGLKIFSPFPLLTIPTMGIEGIYTALKKTKYIAIYQTVSKLVMLVCLVLPVIAWHGDYRSAIVGWGVASLVTFVIAMYMKRKPYVHVKAQLISGMYRTIFNYSLPLMYASIVGMFLHSANQFFVSRYYGAKVFAEFSNGFIPLPFVAMIAGSVKGVLLPLFSKAKSAGNLNDALVVYDSAVRKSINLLYPLIFFVFFFAKDIVVLIYGAQYEVSAPYLRVLLIKDMVEVLPFLAVLLAVGKSYVYFWVHLCAAVLIWGIDFIVVFCGFPPIGIAIVSSAIQILMSVAFFWYLNRKMKIHLFPWKMVAYIGTISSHLILVGAIVALFEQYVILSWPIIGRLGICGVTYYGVLWISGRKIGINYLESVELLLKQWRQ